MSEIENAKLNIENDGERGPLSIFNFQFSIRPVAEVAQ